MNLTAWQRLEKVINWTGLSIHAFAMTIGLKRSENIYRIRRGNNGISKTLAKNITNVFPEVNIDWLLARSDEIFLKLEDNDNSFGIPVYPLDKIQKSEPTDSDSLYHINIPTFHDCDMATFVTGNAMAPTIPHGVTILLKKCDIDNIVPGRCYLIIAGNSTCIRYIRTIAENPEKLRLVPENKTDFDELLMSKMQIEKLYVIQGVISSLSL
jgi:hypothetical protein